MFKIPPKEGLHFQSPPPLKYLPPKPVREDLGREELRSSDYEILETEELEESDSMETEEMRKSDLVLQVNTGMAVERGIYIDLDVVAENLVCRSVFCVH